AVGTSAISLHQHAEAEAWLLWVAVIVVLAGVALDIRHSYALPARTLILGSGSTASRLIDDLDAVKGSRNLIRGLVDNERPAEVRWGKVAWPGKPDQLAQIAQRVRADRIVVAFSDRRGKLPLAQLLESRVRGVAVEDVLDFYERCTGKLA